MIISNKNMPVPVHLFQVRVYSLGKEGEVTWATIYDRKPNSELFLAPLELAKNVSNLSDLGGYNRWGWEKVSFLL